MKKMAAMKKMVFQFTKSTMAVAAVILLSLLMLPASAGTLLPNGKQIFFDSDGNPCAGCSVYFYIPSTTTPKDTYQDSASSILNTNPVVLDSAGTATIYGSGSYRQIFKDALGATIWDKLTSDVTATGVIDFAGTSGGSANAQEVTAGNFTSSNGQAIAFYAGFSNSTSTTLTVSSGSPIAIRKDSIAGPVLLSGGEIITGNLVVVYYDSVGGYFHLLNNAAVAQLNTTNTFSSVQTFSVAPVLSNGVASTLGPLETPCGRLTLTTATPVLTTDVTAATTVYYAPYKCNVVSLYDGTNWNIVQFSETSQTLADSTKSPSAAAVSQVYDLFGWLDSSTFRVTRGPTWATGGGSATARGTGAGSTEIERVAGVLVNKFSITNGPAAQRGIYLGTISTNSSGANGQMSMVFSPTPAAGGTNNGIDVWNMYNRVMMRVVVRDSTNTWAYGTATWRSSNNSTSNRVTFVNGLNEALVSAVAVQSGGSASSGAGFQVGIGVDSTSANSGISSVAYSSGSGGQMGGVSHLSSVPGLGVHYLQMLERGNGTSVDFYGDNGDAAAYQSGMVVTTMQ